MPRLILLLLFLCLSFSLPGNAHAQLNIEISQQQYSPTDATGLTPLENTPKINSGAQKLEDTKTQQQERQLIQAVKAWARAWSNRDAKNYVGAYTRNYKGRKSNHRDWVEYIHARFQQSGKIEVSLNNIYIKSWNTHRAIIDFEQAYKSPTYRDKIIKRIVLSKQESQWKISRELTLSVL